jgi:polyisoprenoid-binding protein YceI
MNIVTGSLIRRAAVVILGLTASTSLLADPPAYTPVAAQSSVSFVGTQQGEKFTGAVRDFDARIAFSPDQIGAGRIDVTIRMRGLSTSSQERDSTLAGAEWFDFAHYPTATFHATALRAAPGGEVGDGELTIKGHTKHFAFPFTWRPAGAGATLDARVTLDRLDYAIGTGEWTDDSIVARKVDVIVHLVLAPALGPSPPAAAATPRRN